MTTAIQVKERPILFSAPMVQAILAGNKTQTRRTVKPKVSELITAFLGGEEDTDISFGFFDDMQNEEGELLPAGWYVWCTDYPYECAAYLGLCPYGLVGDRLWVRETWSCTTNVNNMELWPDRPHKVADADEAKVYSAYIYRADGEWQWLDADGWTTEKSYWKPSIHMPRAASRIQLEVVEIRIERLQEISEPDAMAEGIGEHEIGCPQPQELDGYPKCQCGNLSYVESFSILWQSINGPESWDANPWVWVVDFKPVT